MSLEAVQRKLPINKNLNRFFSRSLLTKFKQYELSERFLYFSWYIIEDRADATDAFSAFYRWVIQKLSYFSDLLFCER